MLRDAILYIMKAKNCRKDISKRMKGKGWSDHKTASLRNAIIDLSGADREILCSLCKDRMNL